MNERWSVTIWSLSNHTAKAPRRCIDFPTLPLELLRKWKIDFKDYYFPCPLGQITPWNAANKRLKSYVFISKCLWFMSFYINIERTGKSTFMWKRLDSPPNVGLEVFPKESSLIKLLQSSVVKTQCTIFKCSCQIFLIIV